MVLADDDRELIESELGREVTSVEAVLFENLWSEHCAYRSSRPLLSAFDSTGDDVVVGPGDDAAVVRVTDDVYIALGIESHNHPSYVDPYDGAATGVGGIVRDILSMGAYPIALADCLYFGAFDDEHPRYLFEGVVEGIADYGNSIGVPTVNGAVTFHEGYEGNPLVNVGCVGLLPADRLVTAAATEPGNKLVLVGNATGRDGLGGASFASEDLAEDAETADRPAVQVGDPYTEKLLIEANEALVDEDLVRAARDLGAAGLGGATSEMVAKGGLGAHIALERVHQREPEMNALEILLAESQERMCYEVRPEDVDDVRAIADRFHLGSAVIGEVTDGNYVCTFEGETVVDLPAELIADGAPMNDLPRAEPASPAPARPDLSVETALEHVLESPNTAEKRWVYRQYDHEVGVRTAVRPGDDAAVMALREAGTGLAIASGAEPLWTAVAPYDGARAVALEAATNLAAKGATPIATVDCLNGGNPEKPAVYGGFAAAVDGIADMCRALSVPVVGGNVSLYNDSPAGPIPPTPTLMMVGTTEAFEAPTARLSGEGSLVLLGERSTVLGGSELLHRAGGTDHFPSLPRSPADRIQTLVEVASRDDVLSTHDISHGGLAVTLAEMISADVGASITLSASDPVGLLCSEAPGRVVVETTSPSALEEAVDAPTLRLGEADRSGRLELAVDDRTFSFTAAEVADRRRVIERELD